MTGYLWRLFWNVDDLEPLNILRYDNNKDDNTVEYVLYVKLFQPIDSISCSSIENIARRCLAIIAFKALRQIYANGF